MSTFKERAGGYLREAPGGVNLEKLFVYGAMLAAGYFLYKTISTASKVAGAVTGAAGSAAHAVTAAGGATGRAIYDWFHPDTVGETVFYTVQFPDGSRHSVPSRSVAKDGSFLYNNVRYRMAIDRSIVSGVNKFAVKL